MEGGRERGRDGGIREGERENQSMLLSTAQLSDPVADRRPLAPTCGVPNIAESQAHLVLSWDEPQLRWAARFLAIRLVKQTQRRVRPQI